MYTQMEKRASELPSLSRSSSWGIEVISRGSANFSHHRGSGIYLSSTSPRKLEPREHNREYSQCSFGSVRIRLGIIDRLGITGIRDHLCCYVFTWGSLYYYTGSVHTFLRYWRRPLRSNWYFSVLDTLLFNISSTCNHIHNLSDSIVAVYLDHFLLPSV